MNLPFEEEYLDAVRQQCPDCPDGQVWTSKGPTGETCPTCGGEAFVWVARLQAGKEGTK